MAVNLPDIPPGAVVPAAMYALARVLEASTPLVRAILQHRRALANLESNRRAREGRHRVNQGATRGVATEARAGSTATMRSDDRPT